MNGTLELGSHLNEVQLARQLGISRGPLREALQRLIQQGLARAEPHHGVFINELHQDAINDIYIARSAIEATACRVAMHRDRRCVADRLSGPYRVMTDAVRHRDGLAYSAADMRFHQHLVEASGSGRLTRMAGTLFVETRAHMTAVQTGLPTSDAMLEIHERIIESIRDGDEERALEEIAAHMRCEARLLTMDTEPPTSHRHVS